VTEQGHKRAGFFRWFLYAVLALATAPVVLALFARTPLMREYARQEAERAIRAELGLTGVIADIDVEPRTQTFVARHITLDHPEHGRFVEADSLRIRPSWLALFRGRIDLHNISIDRASVWLVLRDGKLINGPVVKSSGKPGAISVDLPFDKLSVTHSRFLLDAEQLGSAALSDISLHLDSARPDVLGVVLSSPRGEVKHRAGVDPIEGLELKARVTDENVQVELLRLHNADLNIALRRASLQLPAALQYQGELELGFNVGSLSRWPLPVKLPPLSGQLSARAKLHNKGDGIHASVELNLARMVFDQYGFGENVHFALQLDKDVIKFDGYSELIRKGGRVDLSGSVGLGPKLPLSVRARVHDVEFAKLMEQLGVSPDAIVDWNLGGGFELRGTLDPLLLSGPLRMPTRDFRVMRDAWHKQPKNLLGVASANLSGTVKVTPKGIFLLDMDAALRNSKLHVDEVMLGFDDALRVRAVGEVFDMRDASPLADFPIAGKGSFSVKVDGIYEAPSVSGHLRFNDFAFGTFPFGDVESDFVLERDVQAVRFPEMLARKGKSRYRAHDFVLDFNDDRLAIDALVRFDHFQLQDFYHVFHYENDERYTPFQAAVSGEARLRYTMDFPGDSPRGTLRADFELGIDEAELSGFQFSAGEAIGSWYWKDHALGYKGGQLEIERFSLRKGDGTVSMSGGMALGGRLDMVVVADKIALRDTEGLRDRMAALGGTYSVAGTIKGEPNLPRIDMEMMASSLTYNGELLGDLRSYVVLTHKNDPFVQEALTWQPGEVPKGAVCPQARAGLARSAWPQDPPIITVGGPTAALDVPMAFLVCGAGLGGRVAYDMAVGRTKVYPLRGELRVKDLPLAKFLPAGSLAAASGGLSGVLRLTDGAMFTPELLAGSLALDRIALGQAGVTLENEGPIALHFGGGRFELEHAAFMGPSTEVRIAGGGSLTGGLALSVDGSVDLGILPTFSPAVSEASGSVQFEVKVSGALDKPGVFGQASAEGASLRLKAAPYPVDAIDAQVTFSAERVLVERISARLMGGTVVMNGAAALQGRKLGSFRLELTGDRLLATPREGVEVAFGGRGELSWKRGDRLPKLQGTLRLGRTRYTRPISVGTTLVELTKKQRVDVDTYDPALENVALDLRVQQSEALHVDNNLIEAELVIDDGKEPFRLLGTDQRFGVLGNMDIRRGTIRVRDRPFTIRDGEITFGSAARVEPRFEVRADTDVRRSVEMGQLHWRVGVHAFGTPESFQFELTSDPYLSQDDIALLLAVGSTQAELAQMATSTLTSTAALEALARVTGVEREVKRALPAIDDVSIGSGYSSRTARTEPQLHLGKRLADRIRVSASTALSGSRDFTSRVEYQISDKTSVGARYNNNRTKLSNSQVGDVGVDLKWRLQFD